MSTIPIQFKVSKGGSVISEITLAQEVIKVGRMSSSHLQIDDEQVSRMHAVIEVSASGQVSIIDLGSETGTAVNGKKVNKAALNSGDTIALGSIEIAVSFGEPAAKPAAKPAVPSAPPPVPSARPLPSPLAAPPAPAVAGIGAPAARAASGARPAPRIVTRPAVPVDVNGLEDSLHYSTEVITLWKNDVLDVVLYQADEKKPRSFCVGEDAGCDFPIPSELIQGQTKLPLVIARPGGGATVTMLPGPKGDITYEDGRRVELSDLASGGQVRPSAEASGCQCFELPPKSRVKIDIGEFSFLVNSVASPRKLVVPWTISWTNQIFNAASLVLHFLVIFLAFFDVPDILGVSLDMLDDASRLVKYDLNAFEIKEKELKKDTQKKDKEEGGTGKRHKGDEGQMGSRTAAKTNNMYGIKGPANNTDLRMARDMAKEAGVLKYLSAVNAPVSPFGSDQPLGADPENALGALMGNQVGENFGYGGLGLRGTGRGGGGTGEGTIGLGSLGTIGHGGGGGSGSGYGRGAGGLGGRRAGAPQIRSGAAMVKGSLSKEVIRRIVHQHINEVRFCYERQLAQRPDLSGRVSIKFMISGTGAVQMSAVAASTIGDPEVENCIAQAVRRWTFPQPEGGGIVIVTYPFMLESSGGE